MSETSEIVNFYAGKTILLTGGTGFLGKLLLEKLLRTCHDVKRIYLLIRVKKDIDVQTRYKEIFEAVVFDVLKQSHPNFLDKIQIMPGDCALPTVGLCEADLNTIRNDVNIIFHCAATVRFDQKLKSAANINVRSVRDLLIIAKQMKELKSFIYVSTAYSNCPRDEIDEVFYEPTLTGKNLLTLMDNVSDKVSDDITEALLGKWDNTYVFTKSVAEEVVKSQSKDLPVAVVRPSIVISTYKDPVPGWIDNYYGPTGVSYAAAIGLLRSLHAVPENKADMVPADYVINAIIAVAWHTWNKKHKDNLIKEETNYIDKTVEIYNYVSAPEKPIDWQTYQKYCLESGMKVPSPRILWHCIFTLNRYKFVHMLYCIFLHLAPAYIVDFIAVCLGKKPMLVDGYKKIHKFCDVISKFATRQWAFSNKNTQALWTGLNSKDKELFPFSMKDLIWKDYFDTYMFGGRVYLFKDPIETIPAGERKFKIMRIAHYTVVTVVLFLLYKLAMLFFSFVF